MKDKHIKVGQKDRGSTSLALKAGFWYVVSTFLLKSVAFITTPIFSRVMTKANYGEFSNYASWQSTLLIITGMELYNTVSRAYYDYKDEYDQYISSVTIISCIITAGFYIAFLLSSKWIFKIVSIPSQYIHILFFTLLCTSCKTIYMTRERTLYRYKSVVIISAIDMLIPTILSLVLVYFASEVNQLSARIYGFYFTSSTIGLFCTVLLIKKGKTFRWNYCKYAFTLSLPLLVHYLTVYLLTSTNTIITKNVLDAEITAIVSMSTSVIHILTILFHSLSGAVTTWLMDNLEQKNYRKIQKETTVYLLMLAILSIGVILFAPEVIWILGGKKYIDSVVLIPGLVLSVFIQSVTTIFTIILTYDKNVTKTAIYTGIIAVLSIVAKVVLLPELGIQSLPIINCIAFVLLFMINHQLVKKAGYGDAIRFGSYVFFIVIVGMFTFSSYTLYDHILLRYGVILIIGVISLVIMYLKREMVLGLLKNKRNKKADM